MVDKDAKSRYLFRIDYIIVQNRISPISVWILASREFFFISRTSINVSVWDNGFSAILVILLQSAMHCTYEPFEYNFRTCRHKVIQLCFNMPAGGFLHRQILKMVFISFAFHSSTLEL